MDNVGDWMSSPAVSAPETLALPEARQLLQTHQIRRLPVLDEQANLVGIVTENDIHRISASTDSDLVEYNLYYRVRDLPLREFMRRPVVTVTPDTPLSDAAHLMLSWRIRGLPVVERGRLIGMITVTDFLRRFLNQSQGQLVRVLH